MSSDLEFILVIPLDESIRFLLHSPNSLILLGFKLQASEVNKNKKHAHRVRRHVWVILLGFFILKQSRER